MTPAVFLDRDDTLIEANSLPTREGVARGDVVDPSLVRLLPGVGAGCARLAASGFVLVVISNQGSVARGATNIRGVERINDRVRALVDAAAGRAVLGAFYFCPFHPLGSVAGFAREHPWRKPGSGAILAAASELEIDLARSWLIGDGERDIEAGIVAGIAQYRCVRVGPQHVDFLRAAEVVIGDVNPVKTEV